MQPHLPCLPKAITNEAEYVTAAEHRPDYLRLSQAGERTNGEDAEVIVFREMMLSDVEQISAMEEAYFSMPWSKQALSEAAAGDQTFYMVAEDMADGRIVAYCGQYCIMGEGDINQVAVHEAYRRQGIAARLLQDFMQESEKRGIHSFTLEVRVSNTAAIRLYESCGFQIEGTRKGFYDKPKEDAYIMWKR